MVPRGGPVKLIAHMDNWPEKYMQKTTDGDLVENAKHLISLRKDTAASMAQMDELILEMCASCPPVTQVEHLRLYKKFIVIQQKMLEEIEEFDNTQSWFPEDEITGGNFIYSDTKIMRHAVVMESFMTSQGDKYSVELRDPQTVRDMSHTKGSLQGSNEGEDELVVVDTVLLDLKAGRQLSHRIESGVHRGRLLFYDAWNHDVFAEQSGESSVQAYPDPAEIFGPKYSAYNVEVGIQDYKFDNDARGPIQPTICFCCPGPRKLHYRYKFTKPTGKPEVQYLYQDM